MGTYFPEGMPLPAIETDNKGFWEAAKKHKLVIQHCKRCGTFRHIPVPVCAVCYSFEYDWVESQGIGDIYTYTIVVHPAHAATLKAVPYNAVVVQLRDCGGMKVTGNMPATRNEDIRVGMPVRVIWEDVNDEISLPRFEPLNC